MILQYITVRTENAALQINRKKFIEEWFEVPNSVSYVTVYVRMQNAEKKASEKPQKIL